MKVISKSFVNFRGCFNTPQLSTDQFLEKAKQLRRAIEENRFKSVFVNQRHYLLTLKKLNYMGYIWIQFMKIKKQLKYPLQATPLISIKVSIISKSEAIFTVFVWPAFYLYFYVIYHCQSFMIIFYVSCARAWKLRDSE